MNIKLSPDFLNKILNNNFGTPDNSYSNTQVYIGLGIEFDEENFEFSKEPVSKGFTINENPCVFSEPMNGIIRNINAIEWKKAKVNWTETGETIKYIGLYYRKENETLDQDTEYQYELFGILPLVPEETVLINEKMVLNPNTIQIKLSNR